MSYKNTNYMSKDKSNFIKRTIRDTNNMHNLKMIIILIIVEGLICTWFLYSH